MTTTAADVVDFWRDAGPERWFKKDESFDAGFRSRFLAAHEAAARGEHDDWQATADGALALLVLLDQFPRNSFRNTARMFATDARARGVARTAIVAGLDRQVDAALRAFFYLPFMHSEELADQEWSVALNRPLGDQSLRFAILHLEIIQKFGRFPHRNPLLGRDTTPQEQRYLDEGGFAG